MATAVNIPYSPRGYYLRPNEVEVPVEEYLRSSYDPDMDYVDGHVEERNMGDFDHSEMQGAILTFLSTWAREWGVWVMPECRMQVAQDRYRIPDIMLLPRGERPNRIVRQPPLVCIEILSPDDTFRRMLSRVDDYVAMGVPNVWVLDPLDGRVFVAANGRRHFTEDRVLRVAGTQIVLDLDAIKAEIEG